MTYTVTVGDGAQALDVETILNYLQSNAVLSDLEVTVDTGDLDESDTLSVASGDALVDGTEHSVSQTSVQIDSESSDDPRKDVVYVDESGTVQVEKGQPAEAEPVNEDTGQPAIRRHAHSPAPPDLAETTGTPLAEVWVGDDADTLQSADVSDRRPPGLIETALLQEIATTDLAFDTATQDELDSHADLTNIHHAEDHAARHQVGGADQTDVETLPTEGDNGEIPIAQGDGTLAMQVPGGLGADYQEFTSDGTWNKPSDINAVYVVAIGAGGGGGHSASNNEGSGGGGGEVMRAMYPADALPSQVSVTVGDGGAAGNESSGDDGGDSQFHNTIAHGGSGGGVVGNPGSGGGIGVSQEGGSGGSPAEYGGGGGGSSGESDPGGDSLFGAAGGGCDEEGGGGVGSFGSGNGPAAGSDGSDYNGSFRTGEGAGGAGDGSPAGDGGIPGGGGGGANDVTGGAAGSGGRGEVRVWAW